jgi:hypothetical protein
MTSAGGLWGLVCGEGTAEPGSDPLDVDAVEFGIWRLPHWLSTSWRLLKSVIWGENSGISPEASAGEADAPVKCEVRPWVWDEEMDEAREWVRDRRPKRSGSPERYSSPTEDSGETAFW